MGKGIKTIGILTWHRCHNYGALLQAYALQHFLKEKCIGYAPEFINDRKQSLYPGIGTHLLYPRRKGPRDRFWLDGLRFQYRNVMVERGAAFEEFIENVLISSPDMYARPIDLLSNLPQYDIYMSGGDQIWNVRYSLSPHFQNAFLWFTKSPNKLAYGSGMCDFETHRFPLNILAMLRDYKKIMVREREGAENLKKYLMRDDIEQVLDPTLLLDPSDYAGIQNDAGAATPYIFVYLFDHLDGEYRKIIKLSERLAKRLGLKVALISNSVPVFNSTTTTYLGAGPREWLHLIAHAELVLTNSFHGTAFALIYNKPFYLFRKDLRKTNLLRTAGVEDRFVTLQSDVIRLASSYIIDYSQPNIRLKKERERCAGLLKGALSSCE